jgi:hypothetical protein
MLLRFQSFVGQRIIVLAYLTSAGSMLTAAIQSQHFRTWDDCRRAPPSCRNNDILVGPWPAMIAVGRRLRGDWELRKLNCCPGVELVVVFVRCWTDTSWSGSRALAISALDLSEIRQALDPIG